MIKKNLPPSLHPLLHENLHTDHMHDDKHIAKRYLGTIFVKGMRFKIQDSIQDSKDFLPIND